MAPCGVIALRLILGFGTCSVQFLLTSARQGRDAFYVFDCLSELQSVWYTDLISGYDLGADYIWSVYGQSVTPAEQAEAMRGTWQAYIDAANGQ